VSFQIKAPWLCTSVLRWPRSQPPAKRATHPHPHGSLQHVQQAHPLHPYAPATGLFSGSDEYPHLYIDLGTSISRFDVVKAPIAASPLHVLHQERDQIGREDGCIRRPAAVTA